MYSLYDIYRIHLLQTFFTCFNLIFFSFPDGDDLDILGKRNRSISSSIDGGGVGGDLLDNCLEEISSTSTSMSSSREPSPDRYIHTTSTNHYSHQSKHVVTASATTMAVASSAITNTSTAVCSNNNTNSSIGGGGTGQVKQQHHHHSQSSGTGASEKNSSLCTNLERKKSVDTA